ARMSKHSGCRSRGHRASDRSFRSLRHVRLGFGHGVIPKEAPAMWGTFTSSNSALLLIDHQVGTMKLIKNIPLEVAKRNTVALAKTAKVLGLPVVLTTSLEEEFQG